MSNRDPNEPLSAKRHRSGVWLGLAVVLAYPVVAYIAMAVAAALNDYVYTNDFVFYAVVTVAVLLAVVAFAWLVTRLGAPLTVRWTGLGYAVAYFVLGTYVTTNETTFANAMAASAIPALILAVVGVAWWLGVVRFSRRS